MCESFQSAATGATTVITLARVSSPRPASRPTGLGATFITSSCPAGGRCATLVLAHMTRTYIYDPVTRHRAVPMFHFNRRSEAPTARPIIVPKEPFRSFGTGLTGSGTMSTLIDDLVPDERWTLVEPLLPTPPRPPYGG